MAKITDRNMQELIRLQGLVKNSEYKRFLEKVQINLEAVDYKLDEFMDNPLQIDHLEKFNYYLAYKRILKEFLFIKQEIEEELLEVSSVPQTSPEAEEGVIKEKQGVVFKSPLTETQGV